MKVKVHRLSSTTQALPSDVEGWLRLILAQLGETTDPDLPPDAPSSGVEEVIEVLVEGQRYFLIRSQLPLPSEINLSPREKEVVRLVARGLPNKAIAAVLEISAWTVATHLRRIFTKLEVSTRAEMVARALKEGLLADPDASAS